MYFKQYSRQRFKYPDVFNFDRKIDFHWSHFYPELYSQEQQRIHFWTLAFVIHIFLN